MREASALWFPEVGQIRNPRLTKALRIAIDKRIDIREHEEVLELRTENGRITGARTTAGQIDTEQVIVCTGAWTAQLLEKLGRKPDIRPVRGQMILFFAKPGQIHHVTLFRERYVIPRKDGRVLIGSTLEDAGFEKRTTAEAKEELYRIAIDLFPLLKRTPIEDHWAGLRPASPSGIPYIGPYPERRRLFVNAGHFRNGLVTGPASARLLADLILGREPILPPAALVQRLSTDRAAVPPVPCVRLSRRCPAACRTTPHRCRRRQSDRRCTGEHRHLGSSKRA
jgi:glycine oxidase